jgi:cyclopropane-fatty-acyl-phospholipid synthase
MAPVEQVGAAPRLTVPPTAWPTRWLRLVTDGFTYGPPSAAVNFFTASEKPVDPETVWRLFTRRYPRFLQFVVDNYPPAARRARLIDQLMHQSHAGGIEYHYDLSNEFYRLFLDKRFMFYSCADFNTPGDTLEQAQLNKANHILSLIDPKPGEAILELGSGWGSMLRHIHDHTGDKANLSGYTLSREQKRYVEENFGFNVMLDDFVTTDLGRERYDKIYSIGAMEHVRPDELLPLARKIHAALKPGGRAVHHFFSLNGHDPKATSMVTAQLFFPGSILALHDQHLAVAREAGFNVTHDSKHDYRPTLRAWFERLVANRDKAHALVGVQQTNKYLAFFSTSWAFFNLEQATLHRLVLEKT